MVGRAALPIVGGIGALFASTDFKTTISLGSIIVAMLVVVLFGLFSYRDRRNSGWKDLYEQKSERVENLLEEKEAERVVRHAIKDELAQTKALLKIEEAKPDMSIILDRQQALWTDAIGQLTSVLAGIQQNQVEMAELLRDIKGGAS
jgi:hypothetical protein